MKIVPLYESLSVSGQIKLADIKLIAARSLTTIINNRPDGEESRQSRLDTLAKRASEIGKIYHYLPVISGGMIEDNVAKFTCIMKNSHGPVLANCQTGTRSTILWTKSQRGRLPVNTIIEQASSAG